MFQAHPVAEYKRVVSIRSSHQFDSFTLVVQPSIGFDMRVSGAAED